MRYKASLLDEGQITTALKRLSFQIVEQSRIDDSLVLLGIRRRGVPLAQRIAANIREHTGYTVSVGELDITFYRDDLTRCYPDPVVNASAISVDMTGKHVILVDDVLYTGRTVRAAMDAVMDLGRAASIRLAVLVDRGHRELPIKANFVGKNIPTTENEFIQVQLVECDGTNAVSMCERQDA